MARAGPEKAVRPSYGDLLNSFAMKARAGCEIKQLCCNCYINPESREHSEFC